MKKLLSALLVVGTLVSATGCIITTPRRTCATGSYWNGNRCALARRPVYYRRAPVKRAPARQPVLLERDHRRR